MTENILVARSSMPPYEEFIKEIRPLWDSHWLTNMGVYHKQLEQKLKDYLEVPQLSLLVNGHMALELTLEAFGFPEGSEVITTPFTFISTTHAIVRKHLKPVFCDVKASDGTIDETKIEALITDKTVAILPVHVYGNVCNVEAIQNIANQYHLKVIYDAAHAFGVSYKGRGIGTYGDAAMFSFHATKVYHTIEGGAVAFSEPAYYEKLQRLKNFGICGEELVESVGANAKMNEFSAIMGLCNLKYIEREFQNRKERYEYYKNALKEERGIHFFEEKEEVRKNYAYFPILIGDEYSLSRDELCVHLRENGIYCRKYFYPAIVDQACFKGQYEKVNVKVARDLAARVLTILFYADLEWEKMDSILENIKRG